MNRPFVSTPHDLNATGRGANGTTLKHPSECHIPTPGSKKIIEL
jgi:hypothetical protein